MITQAFAEDLRNATTKSECAIERIDYRREREVIGNPRHPFLKTPSLHSFDTIEIEFRKEVSQEQIETFIEYVQNKYNIVLYLKDHEFYVKDPQGPLRTILRFELQNR